MHASTLWIYLFNANNHNANNLIYLIFNMFKLFKVMSNQEAVDIIRDVKEARSSAKRLTEEALSRKSTDDISCIVVKFQ